VDGRDIFEHVRKGAKADCPVCHGTGAVQYDDHHFQPCERCCRHDLGFCPLTPSHMGYSEGYRWCCLGCGFSVPFNPAEPG
jgi:hypothetical protein